MCGSLSCQLDCGDPTPTVRPPNGPAAQAMVITVSPADLAHRDHVLARHAVLEVARGHVTSTALSPAEARVALDRIDRSRHRA